MIQAIADNGRLVAYHANLRIREGVSGGASIKESITLPVMPEIIARMVRALNWHGALSLDAIVTPSGPLVIDVNPRLVEPMNAYFAGVDLVSVMLDLAQSGHPAVLHPGKAGVRSCQLLLAILGAAQKDGTRQAIIRELVAALYRRGEYAAAHEELTPLYRDPVAAVPVIVATLLTLFRTSLWQTFQSGAVGPYALTPKAWNQILSAGSIDAARPAESHLKSNIQRGLMAVPITLYGIKNSDTMNKARAWLDKHGIDYSFHDYKTAGIERERLERWEKKIGWETLLNRADTTFRKLSDKDKNGLDARKAVALMLAQPSVIKRPVLDLGGGKLLVGFAPEQYEAVLEARR